MPDYLPISLAGGRGYIDFIMPPHMLECHDIAESGAKHKKSINQSILSISQIVGQKTRIQLFF